MISRIWYGWTTPANADVYEQLIRTQIFPRIGARGIAGLKRMELYRRDAGEEVEFVTILCFDSWVAVEAFAGPDRDRAVVPQEAREVLSRFEESARHYDMRVGSPPL